MIELRFPSLRVARRIPPACAAALAIAACWVVAPCAVHAQSTFNPYVSAQAEHDSNVFRVENSTVAEQFYGGSQLGDYDERYVAGMEGTYLWSLQKLSATLEARKIDYDHFTFLDHYEYLANLQLDWKLGSLLDGSVQFHQERLAASFADRDSPGLEIDTDRNITGKLNFIIRTDWRLETGVNFHTYYAPLQFYTDFVEHETGSHLGVSYNGIANVTYGIGVDRIDGNYVHAPGVGPYNQTSASARFNYQINGLETITGSLGYTKRNQSIGTLGALSGDYSYQEQGVGAATGQFKYLRQLTGKTSVTVQAVRTINSYVASGGSEVDTTGSVGVLWQATYKLSVGLTYSYESSTYLGQVIPGSTAAGRTDHLPGESVNITYLALRQLQIKGYFNGQTRRSNYAFDRFNDSTAGIQALAHWR